MRRDPETREREGGRVSKRRRSFCDSGQVLRERARERDGLAPPLRHEEQRGAEEGEIISSDGRTDGRTDRRTRPRARARARWN